MTGAAHAPEPRASYDLIGCEAQERAFLEALELGRLHHAWLLTGPRGVGKATFAFRAARRLLGAKPDQSRGLMGSAPDDPVCRRVESGAHADLTVLTRPYDEKRGRYKGVITVEEARRFPDAFASTAGEGGWRVAIVDAADDLNANAANAILKTLEEPPQKAVVLLVAHAPGLLPPTVRSRCRRLAFAAPGEAVAADVVERLLGVDAKIAVAAARLARGRPGEAVRLAAADVTALAARLERVFEALPRLDAEEAQKLADLLGGRDAEDPRAFFFDALREHALARARAGRGVEAWAGLWDRASGLERALDGLNLDPRAVVLEALNAARDASSEAGSAQAA
jgi:DNA polymerase-3 subunit delta'